MKFVVINGPNLNFLGIREPEIYGTETLEDINNSLQTMADQENFEIDFFQSNIEGEIINYIQEIYLEGVDGIVINPAAYTHYSYAIHDTIKGIETPAVEIHLSAIHTREDFRKESVIAPACIGQISGFGAAGYELALTALIKKLNEG